MAVFLGPFISEYPYGALGCFSVAARQCRAASIEATERGVDGGTDYVFTIEPGGDACRVSELRQDYGAIPGTPPPRLSPRRAA